MIEYDEKRETYHFHALLDQSLYCQGHLPHLGHQGNQKGPIHVWVWAIHFSKCVYNKLWSVPEILSLLCINKQKRFSNEQKAGPSS